MSHTTALITLGHNNLSVPTAQARFLLADTLQIFGAQVLATFLDGAGEWDGQVETTDAFLVSIPTGGLNPLRTALSTLAEDWHEDAIGFLIHDHANYGPSYVRATGAGA